MKVGNILACLIFFLFLAPTQALPIHVIQLNTWGVPYVVKDLNRYWDAMKSLETTGPDFIVLEEVFSRKGRGAFHSDAYPFEVRGPRAFPRIVNSGLRILSKHPVIRSAQVVFCQCVGEDCLARKGAVIAVIRLPHRLTLNLVATHLNSRGDDSIRVSQLKQIQSLIERYGDPDAPLVFAGDFNFNPTSELYPHMLERFGIKDVWTETHSSSDVGYTYDSYENPYAHTFSLEHNFPLTRERIDFILFREGLKTGIQARDSKVLFREQPLFSDHYGVSGEFEIEEPLKTASSR